VTRAVGLGGGSSRGLPKNAPGPETGTKGGKKLQPQDRQGKITRRPKRGEEGESDYTAAKPGGPKISN